MEPIFELKAHNFVSKDTDPFRNTHEIDPVQAESIRSLRIVAVVERN